MGVAKCCKERKFVDEALSELRGCCALVAEYLDSNIVPTLRVERTVYLSHTAGADALCDGISIKQY